MVGPPFIEIHCPTRRTAMIVECQRGVMYSNPLICRRSPCLMKLSQGLMLGPAGQMLSLRHSPVMEDTLQTFQRAMASSAAILSARTTEDFAIPMYSSKNVCSDHQLKLRSVCESGVTLRRSASSDGNRVTSDTLVSPGNQRRSRGTVEGFAG